MKKETDLQREIIDGWEDMDPRHYGLKLSNAYTSGVPDLLLSGGGAYIVEIKKVTKLPVRPDTRVSFDHTLTAIQNNALIRLRKGGTWAAWWCVHRTFHEDGIFVGHSLADIPTQEEFIAQCIIRKRGQPWATVFPQLLALTRVPAHGCHQQFVTV